MKLKIKAGIKKAYSEIEAYPVDKKITVEGVGEVPVAASIGWDSDGDLWSNFQLDFSEWASGSLFIKLPYGTYLENEDVSDMDSGDMAYALDMDELIAKLPKSIPYKKVKAWAKKEGINLDNVLSKSLF